MMPAGLQRLLDKHLAPAWYLTAPLECTYGEQLQAGLRALQAKSPIIGDVRGKGLMTGIEFVQPDGAPNPEAVEQVKARVLTDGVLISRCGPCNQVRRCAPPLIITEKQVEDFLEVIRGAVDSVDAGTTA